MRTSLSRRLRRIDRASAGSLLVFGIGLLFIGFFLMIMGFAFDRITDVHSLIFAGGVIPVTQEEVDTMHSLTLMFKSCAIFIPIGFGVSLWANSTRVTPGEI